eukprot:14398733-Ditylum_brightwellii.AAC.1
MMLLHLFLLISHSALRKHIAVLLNTDVWQKIQKKLLLVVTGHEGGVHLDVVPDADAFSQVGHRGRGERTHMNAGSGAAIVAGALGAGH